MLTLKYNFFIALFVMFIMQAAVADTVKILPLGDSITAGDGPDGANARPSYRRDLWHSLMNAGYDVDFVGSRHDYTNTTIPAALQDFDPDYEGWPGETAVQINTALNTRMAGYTPDIALVHVGTNDILASSYNPAQDDTIILSEIGGIISKLRIKNPNIVILLAKLIPIEDNNSNADNFNSKLENEISVYNSAAPASPAIVLVDQHSNMVRPDDYWDSPSIHPSESGEQKMATQWFNHLTQQQKLSANQSGDSTLNVPVTNGLTLWLDASDIDANNIVDAVSTSEVPVWKDKSGSANDVSQIVGAGAPSILANELNNLPTLDFFQDGLIAPDTDQITANGSYTKFVVFKFDSPVQNNLISSSETALWEGDSGAIRVWHGDTDNYVMTSVDNAVDRSKYHIAATRYGKPDSIPNVLNLDGMDVNIQSPNSPLQDHDASATSIGSFSNGNFNLDGKIAEALIFNRALTNTEINQVENYLSSKWGLPLAPISDADATTSTISVNASSVIANGSSTATITVQTKDANGDNLTIGGDNIIISSTGSANVTATTDNGNGTYTATISSSVAEIVNITAILNSVVMTNTTGVIFTADSNNNSSADIIPILQILLLETEQ
jgi:lysophospholipase L1-like esterase